MRMNHINYPNENSQIYCRIDNKVIKLDESGEFWNKCSQCPLFNGDYQGMGVECIWEDVDNANSYVSDPKHEFLRVSRAIDEGKLKKY